MRKFFLKFMLTFFIIPTVLFADPGNDLVKLLSNIKTMQANFKQQALGKKSQLRQNAKGVMALERPGKFRWDIKNPNRQLIIADSRTLYLYDIDLQQVTVQNLQKSIGHSPAMILSGSVNSLLNNYKVAAGKNDGKGQWYFLEAKQRNESYAAVELYFVKGNISQMKITDNLGQRSLITFSNVKLNAKVAPQLFSLQIPKGVDLIRQ